MSHLRLVVDNSAGEQSELFYEEPDPIEELEDEFEDDCEFEDEYESEYDQLLLERDRLLLEREANREHYEERLDPGRKIHGLRLVTWVRLGIIALFFWYAV